DIGNGYGGGIRLRGHSKTAIHRRNCVGDTGSGQRIGGAVADDLPVQRVDLIDVILDHDDVALRDVELSEDRRAVERACFKRDRVLHAVDRELRIGGRHRVDVASPDHGVRLDVGVDDVDCAVDRELVRIDGINLLIAGAADLGAGGIQVEGVE